MTSFFNSLSLYYFYWELYIWLYNINMSVIEDVLKEEVKRLEGNIHFFSNMLKSIPRGTVSIQKINNNYFVYRKKKVDGRVVSEYIGKKGSKESIKAFEDAEKYRKVKKDLRITMSEYKKLRRVYKIYG